jgi:hypothetical protein
MAVVHLPAARVMPSTARLRLTTAASSEKVGGCFQQSSDADTAPAVPAAHQVTDLAFDLRAAGPVVGLPRGSVRLVRAAANLAS